MVITGAEQPAATTALTQPGQHTFTCTVTDGAGAAKTASASVNVSAPLPDTVRSGDTVADCIDLPSAQDKWTFSGTLGQRVRIVVACTSGDVQPAVQLYPPGGGTAEATGTGWSSSVTLERQLATSGQYSIVISDSGNDNTGCYNLSLLLLGGAMTSASDPDGGAIASGETISAQVNVLSDMDGFTFSGTMGRRVRIAVTRTSGDLEPAVFLYPPGGGGAEVSDEAWYESTASIDRQLSANGQYTIVVEDADADKMGGYNITVLDLGDTLTSPIDADGGPIVSGETLSAQVNVLSDMDGFTFSGTMGRRVRIVVSRTSGDLEPAVFLYPPGGGTIEASGQAWYQSTTSIDRQLSGNGQYTVVVADADHNKLGGYNITFLDLSGSLTSATDPDGGVIYSGQTLSGQINSLSDMDAFTFVGTLGQRVRIVVTRTSGDLEPAVYLYPAGGGQAEASDEAWYEASASIERQLSTGGQYTIVVQDADDDKIGRYNITVQAF